MLSFGGRPDIFLISIMAFFKCRLWNILTKLNAEINCLHNKQMYREGKVKNNCVFLFVRVVVSSWCNLKMMWSRRCGYRWRVKQKNESFSRYWTTSTIVNLRTWDNELFVFYNLSLKKRYYAANQLGSHCYHAMKKLDIALFHSNYKRIVVRCYGFDFLFFSALLLISDISFGYLYFIFSLRKGSRSSSRL